MAEAICLVIDVGSTASQKAAGPDGSSFLDAARECASLLVERKLFSESKDELGVVLFGTQDTSNNLNYENVRVLERGLCKADWDTVKYLQQHVEGTNVESDWIDAVVVALDFLKSQTEGRKFTALKIVLFSDLGTATDPDQLEIIIGGMKLLNNIDFTHIGPDWVDDNEDHGNGNGHTNGNGHANGNGSNGNDDGAGPSKGEPEKKSRYPRKARTKVQKTNEELIGQLVNETEGMMCSLDLAISTFLYKSKKGKKPFPFKVALEIGPDIKISTTGYVKIRRENPKTWKKCLARGEPMELKADTIFIRNNEQQEPIDAEELVYSHRYGPEMVTLSDADIEEAKYEGGPKSMTLFGFIKKEEIKNTDFVGDGCMVFLPTEGDENSVAALSAFVQAMVESGMVAIVRKVYNKRSTPRMGVLTPEIDSDGKPILVFVELPYSEDKKEFQFAKLYDDKHKPSQDQLDAMDDLIDTMMLVGDDEGEEVDLLPTEEQLNPYYQHLYTSLTHRCLHPGAVLPPVAEHIQRMMDVPPELQSASIPVLQRVRQLFPTELLVAKKNKRTGDALFGGDENGKEESPAKRLKSDDLEMSSTVTEVGSTTPVEDFQYLLSHKVTSGVTLDSAGHQMEAVVSRLMASAFGTDMNRKITACLAAYRLAWSQSGGGSCFSHAKGGEWRGWQWSSGG